MSFNNAILIGSVLLLPACGGDSSSTEDGPTPEPAAPAAEALPDQMDAGALAGQADNVTLVPSPLETQRVLSAAGIEANLAQFMSEREVQFPDNTDEDRMAVTTGVVLADMLLTVKTSNDEQLLTQLMQIQSGMNSLKAGDDIAATVADIAERVKAGAVDRENLLKELDELSGVVIPELQFEGRSRIVPLIQAGSWLEGAFLISSAAMSADKAEAADQVLKQPDVVAYFQEYTASKTEDNSLVGKVLSDTLQKLHELAQKTEPLQASEVEEVISLTGSVLKLL
ncbi:MAG: hypothetical protein VX519_12010 [Myxococcota bacterium]|nr:hypothetical protein [Myxococcota bacterium]